MKQNEAVDTFLYVDALIRITTVPWLMEPSTAARSMRMRLISRELRCTDETKTKRNKTKRNENKRKQNEAVDTFVYVDALMECRYFEMVDA